MTSSATKRTFSLELRRSVFVGVMETAIATFMMLIAVRIWHAGSLPKGFLAAASSIGLLLSPVLVALVQSRRWKAAHAAAGVIAAGAVALLLAAFSPSGPPFIILCIFAVATIFIPVPLLTQIYQDNYPDSKRGRLFARPYMLRIVVAAGFSALAGWALSGHLERWRLLMGIYAACSLASAWLLFRIPSRPLAPASASPLRALRYVRDDRLFRWVLISWMLMGFGNLMVLPLRVEYLANPKYGLALSAMAVAVLTGLIPNAVRLALNPLWAWLFDRMNFFVMRIMLNAGFMLGTISFFTGESTAGLVIGAVFYGVAGAGGDIAWNLWVTKIAPPARVADYMSVHTFFNGLRSLVAPILSFQLAGVVGVTALGWTSVGFILAASAMLIPEVLAGDIKRARELPEVTQ